MNVRTAGRIVVSKTVNERNLGMTADYGRNVNGFRAPLFQHRNDFEVLQYGLDFRRVLRLQRADDDVLTSFVAAALIQHLEGLAYSGGIAEKNLEPAAAFPSFL